MAAMSKKRILVVDDEPQIVLMLSGRLRALGYEVQGASGGEDGLKKIQESKPDLVLLDVLMPVMNGLECLTQIKANPHTAEIPVLMVTALVQPADVQRAHEKGARGYVTKPFDPAQLAKQIAEIVQ